MIVLTQLTVQLHRLCKAVFVLQSMSSKRQFGAECSRPNKHAAFALSDLQKHPTLTMTSPSLGTSNSNVVHVPLHKEFIYSSPRSCSYFPIRFKQVNSILEAHSVNTRLGKGRSLEAVRRESGSVHWQSVGLHIPRPEFESRQRA